MSRPPPNGQYNGSNPSLSGTTMNTGNTSAMNSQSTLAAPRSAPQAPSASASRAERFEDEKRRIIESCFSKVDQNGQLAESYITHIRIIEDAQHPSNPAPPESVAENKKPRLIIIAVRSTGRVRMHKARENNNGSFSIGKTWNLEELSAIESYSGDSSPRLNDKIANYRSWAGDIGFTVTLTKPYYWQAGTSKEKDFFIASAVKIYRKYTKGQVPELRGFGDKERAMMLGNMPGQQPPSAATSRQVSENQMPPPDPPQPPFAQRPQSREQSRYRGSPGPPPSMNERRAPSSSNSRMASESPARAPRPPPLSNGAAQGVPRPFASTEHMRAASGERSRLDTRPGTSPAPGYPRGPPSAQASEVPPLSPKPDAQVHPLPAGPQSRERSNNFQRANDPGVEERQRENAPPANGPPIGANLFNAARQRMKDQQQGQPDDYQLPQLDTAQPPQPSSRHMTPTERAPPSAKSEASSAGIDMNDAGTVGALTSYWGPEPTSAAPQPPFANDVQSPPTPERSMKRPPVENRPSESSVDLRPPPLKQGGRGSMDGRSVDAKSMDGNSSYATPREGSIASTSPPEETPQVPPLAVQNKSEPPAQNTPVAVEEPQSGPASSETPEPTEEGATGDEYRPGLGPMIKKQRAADRFKKAATAANAFKPRPGGAAERILKAKADREAGAEPDGITAVVPRPATRQGTQEESRPSTPADNAIKPSVSQDAPKLEVTSPTSPPQDQQRSVSDLHERVELKDEPIVEQPPKEEKEQPEQQEPRKPATKFKRRSNQQEKYIASLGVDSSLLAGKGLDFDYALSDYGWNDSALGTKQLSDFEMSIKRELGRAEAGTWLSQTDEARDGKVAQVEGLLDKAIAECDELEGLLTLYSVELSSLNDDIAFVEAQSQGLQVQSANQKLLQGELHSLMDTMSLDKRVLGPLKSEDLSDRTGIAEVEKSLVRLYQAMLTIDPTIRAVAGRPKSRSNEMELGRMVALKAKRSDYEREAANFCQRLMQHLDLTFNTALNTARDRALQPSTAGPHQLNKDAFAAARSGLWAYGPLILFTKEMNQPAWNTLMRMYHTRAKPLYTNTFSTNISNWKRAVRKPTGDEADMLFTTQEKDATDGGLSSTARKITVKRSQTLAKTLRATSESKQLSSTTAKPGAMMPSEVFGRALDEMAPLISMEQNFMVDLFQCTSLTSLDFLDAVSAAPPENRSGTYLLEQKPTEPNRDLARKLTSIMEEIFAPFASEIGSLLDWTIATDPIQGVGVLASLSKHAFYTAESSQEFLHQLFITLSNRLQTLFTKFVDDQIRAIEDTKVKIKKRKGVIAFMKIFPYFSASVENVFAAVAGRDYEARAACVSNVRVVLDEAYTRINRAMFDSLKVIAKESPGSQAVGGGGRPSGAAVAGAADEAEQKELLNYHVLLIENMNHYVEEVDDAGGNSAVLSEWRGKALLERDEALKGYVAQVLRRPLGKLIDYLDSLTSLLTTLPPTTLPQTLAQRPSYSRKTMRNLLSQHESRELRKGVETLKKRIEKHFGDADEPSLSRGLVELVQTACRKEYESVLDRAEEVVRLVYPAVEGEKEVGIEWRREGLGW
ncbi:hypothetical protein MBLNU230_g8466t2 [Neophaeotheca triangularis]